MPLLTFLGTWYILWYKIKLIQIRIVQGHNMVAKFTVTRRAGTLCWYYKSSSLIDTSFHITKLLFHFVFTFSFYIKLISFPWSRYAISSSSYLFINFLLQPHICTIAKLGVFQLLFLCILIFFIVKKDVCLNDFLYSASSGSLISVSIFFSMFFTRTSRVCLHCFPLL